MNSPRRDNKSSPVVPPRPSSEEMSNPTAHRLNKENDTSSKSQRTGMMGVMQKVNPFKTTTQASSTASTATDPVSEKTVDGNVPEVKQNLGMFKGVTQKVNPFRSSTQVRKEDPPKDTVDQEKLPEGKQVFQNPGMFTGMMQKVNPFKSTAQTQDSQSIHSDLSSSAGSLAENTTTERQVRKEDPSTDTVGHQVTAKLPEAKQNPGMFTGMMQKVNPFKSTAQNQDTQAVHSNLSSSADSLASTGRRVIKDDPLTDCVDHHATEKLPESKPDTQSIHSDLSSSSGSLAESNSSAGKQNPGMFKGMMQKVNPFKSTALTQETQPSYSDSSSSSDSLSDTSVFSPAENQTVWYTDSEATSSVKSGPQPPQENKKKTGTFQIRRILPGALFGYEAKNTESQPTAQAGLVDVQTLEMAAVPVPGEGNPPDSEDKEEGLMDWWQTVEGWETWKESNTFDADEGEMAVEAVADRVFMAARLFVRLFNQRGASLQQRILELLSLADAADSFHKKTVKASVGGGVASVAGSITTITGLILAPFTMGTSLIVTAVGIGVATAGGVASASANITDTVHSKTDRKKVEKMIQDYQEEMKDIKECLDFLQVGMETLEEWDFDQYVDSISKKYLNQNVKHVMKEGGRAGKALLINTESLINTVQVLNVAGGAAKAAQVMSVTTGVMSGLFLALDVFFLAKDSIELNKGAKTEFAGKIREVCKDLQNGLLELNRIKEQLQKTMDGIEVVEEEEEEEEEEVYESDPEKLAQLEE
ncbi:uncharacterized protein LOC112214575 isoform X4 [Oncorhynchus tshawytscha]|nr:uncharacterized protein LOC112214575 isoform X4 [Oncorhynchus tshawytscha]